MRHRIVVTRWVGANEPHEHVRAWSRKPEVVDRMLVEHTNDEAARLERGRPVKRLSRRSDDGSRILLVRFEGGERVVVKVEARTK